MIVDLSFSIRGKSVPLDHGYALFGAVSRLVPELHEHETWGIHPVGGTRVGPGALGLTPRSRLTIRTPASDIQRLLPLAGKTLELDRHRIVVGTPNVLPLRPATSLHSRFVTIKGGHATPEAFLEFGTKAIERLTKECEELRNAKLQIGQRRVMRIANHTVVGYATAVEVTPEASLFLQINGLGGRRHMGAGLFVPVRS